MPVSSCVSGRAGAEHVLHPDYSREQLHGRWLAIHKDGRMLPYYLVAGEPRPDGRFTLHAQRALAATSAADGSGFALISSEALDQSTVARIQAAPSGSRVSRMRCDFELAEPKAALFWKAFARKTSCARMWGGNLIFR